jgi:CO/xanthine dehydrogenase FAD-binding subunit
MVTRLDIPRPPDGHGSAFRRLTRRRGVDLATVSVAAGVQQDGRVALGLGAVAPRPLLAGSTGPVDLDDESALRTALEDLVRPAAPISDVRGSRAYRVAMVRVLARRAVLAAADRRYPEEMAS